MFTSTLVHFSLLVLLIGARNIIENEGFEKKRRCILVMIKYEPHTLSKGKGHFEKMLIINRDYARHHNYGFLYIESTGIVVDPNYIAEDASGSTSFHVGRNHYRHGSWVKLPLLWNITTFQKISKLYDYIFFLSDTVISPIHRNRSIDDLFFNSMSKQHANATTVLRGNPTPSNAAIVFFNSLPLNGQLPSAGTFLFSPSHPMSETFFRLWWDVDTPNRNARHYYEQEALWILLDRLDNATADKMQFLSQSQPYYSVLSERIFPSDWTRYEDLWLCHFPPPYISSQVEPTTSFNQQKLRNPILSIMLRSIGRYGEDHIQLELMHTEEMKMGMKIDPVVSATAMEERSREDRKAGKFEFELGSGTGRGTTDGHVLRDILWVENTSFVAGIPSLSPSHQYEGRLIRNGPTFWAVINGLRVGFQNYDTFLNHGFVDDMSFEVTAVEESAIPLSQDTFSTETPWSPTHTYFGSKQGFLGLYNLATSNLRNDCARDDELEELVHTPGSRANMFLIYHNDASQSIAESFAKCKTNWINLTRISDTSPFFESSIYIDSLPSTFERWKSLDYVITATYKTVSTRGSEMMVVDASSKHSPFLTLDYIEKMLLVAKQGNWDVVPFIRGQFGMMSFTMYFHHQPFKDAWYALLKALGYTEQQISTYEEVKPFYRNVYIIKPAVLTGLMNFMSDAIKVATSDTHVAALLSKDSTYKSEADPTAIRIFGTPYYQLHPFIFERLPSFYLNFINATICAAESGPCSYNCCG